MYYRQTTLSRHARRGSFFTALLGVAFAGALLGSPAQGQAGPTPPSDYAQGRILVRFRDGVDAPHHGRALGLVRALGSRHLGRLPVESVDLPDDEDAADAVATLQTDPDVEFAEVDARVKPAATPNDPEFGNEWYLSNINAPAAWNVTTGSTNVIVAVLDSGCDPTHPDLAPNYVPGWNFYDNNSDTHDVYGHGTAVAGCVGAAGNNGVGIASVSWSSKIMPCRITDTTGYAYYSTIASGIQWAADHGARIANVSFEGVAGSSAIQSAAQYLYNKGGLTVCAAGNGGTNPGYAASPYLISVSATDSNNALASWSNTGAFITVSAPGVGIETTTNGGGYGYWNGTSFSSPITCGVLALEWAANPALTNSQAEQVLTASADDLGAAGWDSSFGYGKVDAYNAVVRAQATVTNTAPVVTTTPPSVAITNPTGGATVTGTQSVGISATDSKGISKVEFYVDSTLAATTTSAPYTVNWSSASVANGAHTLTAKAYDTAGTAGTSSPVSVTVSNVADTTPPICTITSPTSGVKVSGQLMVAVSATDNVGITQVSLLMDGRLVTSTTSAPYSFTLNTKRWTTGAHTLQAIASDAAGNKGNSAIITVTR